MATLYEARPKNKKPAADALYLKELEPPARGKRIVFDSHPGAPKGFGVRITAQNTVSFVLRYSAEGKDRLLTVGNWPTWSLAGARAEAITLRQQVDKGTDILEARRDARLEPTIKDVFDDWNRLHLIKLTTGPTVARAIELHLLPTLGNRKIGSIRRAEIIAVVEKLAEKRGRSAGKLLGEIKRLFAFAEDRELIMANPAATIKPRKFGSNLTSRFRGRILSEDEIRSFWSRAETCGMHRLTALALKLVLITGQRPGEVVGMHWHEIDEDAAVWTIPAARRKKTNTAMSVPLTDTALALLRDARDEVVRLQKRRRNKLKALVVFETRPGSSLKTASLSRAAQRYAPQLGSHDDTDWGHWAPHDLRRTMRTGLSACGIPDHVSEATIGHTRKGIQAVYDHHTYDAEKRAALEAWERRVLAITKKDPVNALREASHGPASPLAQLRPRRKSKKNT